MKIFKLLAPLTILALLLTSCPPPLDQTPASDAKNMTSFMFTAALNPGVLIADAAATYNDVSGKWEVGPLPVGTVTAGLVATFALSEKASASINDVAQASGVTANNYSSDVTYKITAEDGSTLNVVVAVSVATPATGKEISAFSLTFSGMSRAQSISGTAITVTVPNGTTVSSLLTTFSLSSPLATVKVGGIAVLSGASIDYTSAVDFVVTAQDLSSQTYTVTVTPLPVGAPQLVQSCPVWSNVYAVTGGGSTRGWIDIKIPSKAALGDAGWKIKRASGASAPITLLDSSLTTVIPVAILTALADGDLIRLYDSGMAPKDTTTKADDLVNTTIWDLVSTGSVGSSSNALVWIEKLDGTILDLVAYTNVPTVGSPNSTWITEATALTAFRKAMASGQWDSVALDGALALDTSNSIARLTDAAIAADIGGNKVSDWRSYQSPKVTVTAGANPSAVAVTASADGTTLLTVTSNIYGGATVTAVTADLNTPFGGSFTTSDSLYDDGTNGDVTSGDHIFSRTLTLPMGTASGSKTVVFTVTASTGTLTPSTTLLITPKTILAQTGFEQSETATTLPLSGSPASTDITFNGVSWTMAQPAAGGNAGYINTSSASNGTYGAGFNVLDQSFVSKTSFTNPGVLSFNAKSSGASSNYAIVIEYSTDASVWTVMTTYPTGSFNATSANKTIDFSALADGNYYLRFRVSARTGNSFYFDDIVLQSK